MSQDVMVPAVILGHIVPLDVVEPKEVYAIRRWASPEFGDDEDSLRPWYESLLNGYRHEALTVAIENEEILCLGLVPPDDNLKQVYLEVDEWAMPMKISGEGMVAVRAAEAFVRGSRRDWEMRLEQALKALENESPIVRAAIFSRLLDHVSDTAPEMLSMKDTGDTLLPKLFELLPWQLLNRYIDRVTDLASRGAKALPLERPLPDPIRDLRYYFVYIRRDLSFQLTNLVEQLEEYFAVGDKDKLDLIYRHVPSLIEDLFLARPDLFPQVTRMKLCQMLYALAGSFLNRRALNVEEVGYLVPKQRSIVNLAMVGAYLCASRLTEYVPPGLSLRVRAGNTMWSSFAADRGRLFDNEHVFVRYLHQELAELTKVLSHGVEVTLEDPSIRDRPEVSKMDTLINCADICRWQAQLLVALKGNLEAAHSALRLAIGYYEAAEKLLLSVHLTNPRKFSIFYHRYARCTTLLGRVLVGLRQLPEAEECCKSSLQILNKLSSLTRSFKTDVVDDYGREILRAEAMIQLHVMCGRNGELSSQIEHQLLDLVSKHPNRAIGYEKLYNYYHRGIGDFPKALAWLDHWTEQWRTQGQRMESICWLEYLAARDCAQALEHNPSILVEAARRYVDVICRRPDNYIAASELVEFVGERSRPELDEVLPILDQKLSTVDNIHCPITHAVLRIIFFADSLKPPDRIKSTAQALFALVLGIDNLLPQVMVELAKCNREQLSWALEDLSKWYFRLGRENPQKTELVAAERLIDAFLQIEGDEVVFLTRKFDLSLEQSALEKAESLIARLREMAPNDPIVCLKAAGVAIRKGALDEAGLILENIVAQDPEHVHPAIIDRQAYIYFRRGDFEKSAKLFEELLRRNEFDATANFGLGRVYFESGSKWWGKALQRWIQSLRLRAGDGPQANYFLAEQTASCVASMCYLPMYKTSSEELELRREFLSQLGQILRQEDSRIVCLLVDKLAALGVLDKEAAATVLESMRESSDPILNRRVAQFLMARTIYVVLGVEKGHAMDEITTYVEWCRKRNVLQEYLAGAKGSYGRALARLAMFASLDEVSQALRTDLVSSFRKSLDKPLVDLHDHICSLTRYSPDYYRLAYRLFDCVGTLDNSRWSWFIEGLVRGVASNMWSHMEWAHRRFALVLDSIGPNIGLWPLRDILHIENGDGLQISGWVDRDALGLSQFEFEGNTWRVRDSEVQRYVGSFPKNEEIDLYAKAGIFFKTEPLERVSCSIALTGAADLAHERRLEEEHLAALKP